VQRIALFGGSFDPVHNGHLLVAQAALEELELSRLFFIPAAQSPFKPERQPTPANLRLRLLRLALAGQNRCAIDLQEIQRGGTSYTIDTARSYARRYPEASLFYVIGADHVSQLASWRDATELAKLLQFIVVPRPGEAITEAPKPFRIHALRGFPLSVSSSQIRERIAAGLPIDNLVPPLVAETIQRDRLYLS